MKDWSEDKRTWRDVYATKPYEFLEIIVKGGEPMWSKEKNCFIDKLEVMADEEPITMGKEEALPLTKQEIEDQKTAVTTAPSTTTTDDDEDDLPF